MGFVLFESMEKGGLKMWLADCAPLRGAICKTTFYERGLFTLLVGGDQVEHGKPHPEIYRRAARMLAVAPEQCLALEDSENGVRSALGAGMTVIQIPDIVAPSPQLRALGHIILNNLREIFEYPFKPA